MGVVHLFGSPKRDNGDTSAASAPEPANCNQGSAEVVELVINRRIAHGVTPQAVYEQMEALLVTHGIDFACDKVRADYKIVTYLVAGMMDRAGGAMSSDRCLMLDTLRHALAYEEPVDTRATTDELFGDLLGRLD